MKKRIGRIDILFIILGILVIATSIVSFSAVFEEKEINEIKFSSDGYEENMAGSFNITKNAVWIDEGEAEITFTIDTIEAVDNNKDVILVLDNSKSMEGNKLTTLKKDTVELIDGLLDNENNSVALITFGNDSSIVSDFTTEKEMIVEHINNIEAVGTNTDYYKALKNVEVLLSSYVKKENTDLVVLFLTDGYPNVSNQVAQYRLLKENYPFITINGVQYELGEQVINELVKVTDYQFVSEQDTLENVLFKAVYMPKKYEGFLLTDYIDTRYWYVDSKNDINFKIGEVSFDDESQIVRWNLGDNLYSGDEEVSLSIKIRLKDEFLFEKGLYDTNSKTTVVYKLKGDKSNEISTKETPKLKNYRLITFDSNHPSTCGKSVYSEEHFVFSKVAIPHDQHICAGYSFKGFEVVEDVEYINDNLFVVPTHDVMVRGTWTTSGIVKSMDGTVHEKLTLYKTIEKEYTRGSQYGALYTGPDSENYANNVYYYKGKFKKNNVLFGGFCWKIVRTTDTGGVKIVYNGVPSESGTCNNTDAQSVIGNSTFNPGESPAYVGYMYNKIYPTVYDGLSASFRIYTITGGLANTEYYYADSYEWDGKKYILKNTDGSEVKKLLWSDNWQLLKGSYTCLSQNSECKQLVYLVNNTSEVTHYIGLESGNKIEDLNYKITFGKSYIVNADGTFTLQDVETINRLDWTNNSAKYSKDYFVCSTIDDSQTCSELYRIISSSKYAINYISSANKFSFGNSVSYDSNTGQYQLVDSVSFWEPSSLGNAVNNYHYTCFNAEGVCSEVKYIYYKVGLAGYYSISLGNGETIDDALNKMLLNDDVNKFDSDIKIMVDEWYESNMINYEDYIEDTVYCNDRSFDADNNWSPNGVLTNRMSFNQYSNNTLKTLKCKNGVDKFTVKKENGNGALKYPVGLLTKYESSMLIQNVNQSEEAELYWSMTPGFVASSNVHLYYYSSNNNFDVTHRNTKSVLGVRPVISLKPDIEYISGDGSTKYPYVIDLSE